jgi:hypothetical protein
LILRLMLHVQIGDNLGRLLHVRGTNVKGTIVQICLSECEYEGGGGRGVTIFKYPLSAYRREN